MGAPIVLATFGRRPAGPRYRWPALVSVVLHAALIGLVLWTTRHVMQAKPVEVTVVFRKPPPPPPPPPPAEPAEKQPLKKGGRGVSVAKAVFPEIQSDLRLSVTSTIDPNAEGPTGNWVGGSGSAAGEGWADGLESGTAIKRSLNRDPLEVNSGWECDFPDSEKEGKVTVRIRVHVSPSGAPMRVSIVRPGPPAFNASAIECAMRQRFHPALDVNGKPREGDREVGILFYKMGSSESFGAAPAGPPPEQPPARATNPSG